MGTTGALGLSQSIGLDKSTGNYDNLGIDANELGDMDDAAAAAGGGGFGLFENFNFFD